jgi:transaldolase
LQYWQQLAEWNRTALDAVFGLLTRDELKYVSLFINKIDKWEAGNAPDAEGQIQNQFKTLIKDLKERCDDYAEYDTIIGSAITGDVLQDRTV